jgi:phage terminase small subunit
MALTPKQEAFCLSYLESNNATEAYRKAGYAAEGKTAHEAASRLLKNSKVVARLKELRAPAAERACVTLEGHLETLADLRDRAMSANQFGAAISAEIARGKAAGIHVEKSETTVTTRQLPASVDEFV